MTQKISEISEAATGNAKLAAEITDKKGFAQRWSFSTRHIDNLLAMGLPHLRVGSRRVRIITSEGDAWMREKFHTQRRIQAKTVNAK